MIRGTTNIKSSVFTEHIKPKDPQNNFHKKAYYFSQGKNPEIEIEREILEEDNVLDKEAIRKLLPF